MLQEWFRNLQPAWNDVKQWLDEMSASDPSMFSESSYLVDVVLFRVKFSNNYSLLATIVTTAFVRLLFII